MRWVGEQHVDYAHHRVPVKVIKIMYIIDKSLLNVSTSVRISFALQFVTKGSEWHALGRLGLQATQV